MTKKLIYNQEIRNYRWDPAIKDDSTNVPVQCRHGLAEISSHKIAIETEKSNILSDIKKLGERERELLATLQDKYGVGNINIETGEITPF